MRPKNNADIENKHECPTCGSTLKAWWAIMSQQIYYRFIICLILFGSGFATITFVNTFGEYGVFPLILISVIALLETLIGIGLGLSWGLFSPKITEAPSYASETPSIAPNENFGQEVVILVVIAFIGTMIGVGINMGIVGIFF